ncbi:extracellular solute-binding protein [Globicatella sanguinis]
MKYFKRTRIAFCLILSSFILASCGTQNNVAKNDTANDEIVFWNPFTGADNANIKAMIDEYNKTNPEFKVKNVSIKEGDMYSKIPTVVNSGKDIPDLNIVHAERVIQYKESDMLETFDEILKDFKEINSENYVAEAWNLGEIEGSRYSLPLDIHNWGTFYNKELLDKYGPGVLDDNILTFNEIAEVSEKAKSDGIRGIAVTWVKPNFLETYKQFGGELTEDGTNPTLDNEYSRKTITLFNEMYEKGLTNKDGEDPTQLFLSKKLIFFPEGIWIYNNIKNAEFEYGLTNSPQVGDDISNVVNWASSHQFVMFKNKNRSPEKTKGILEFIEWLRLNSTEWAKAGQNPASLAILEDEVYQNMPQSFFLSSKEQQETLKIFDYKYNGYIADYLDANGFDAIFGKTDIEKFIVNMQKEVSEKINQNN